MALLVKSFKYSSRRCGLTWSVRSNLHKELYIALRYLTVTHGDLNSLAPKVSSDDILNSLPHKVREFVEKNAKLCEPDAVHICDGSEGESQSLIDIMRKGGLIEPLPKYENCWLVRTDPADVARVESKTVISMPDKSQVIPTPKEGVQGKLGHYMSPEELDGAIAERFPSCMKGRTMYVVPFSMGPVGSPLSKIGIELTDSPYVASSMRIMTRMGGKVLDTLGDGDFIRCLHSVGAPLPLQKELVNNWPCNPEKVLITHKPLSNEIISFGSGYGGNSLLGKKCFALRIGSTIARTEGWLAEHMLILGITNPAGEKRYIAAAFPSACGKTNLAMMTPSLPGYKVECVGDDIAWMRFDDQGVLRAINPENGFFGVAPGTNRKTNPIAMDTIAKNTIFTNTAKTSDGGVYWEGLEKETDLDKVEVTSWKNQPWKLGEGPSSHPNSRFCTPAAGCPIIDPEWESSEGVPIDAILFGGRRPEGVPLVYEANDWKHGVLIGAAMKSETTAAAEHKGKSIVHDPFAMRPFFGYNAGKYFEHWLSMDTAGRKMPKIFHVNWFRKSPEGKFMWPGFGDNARVLEYVLKRCAGEDIAVDSPIGKLPKAGTINVEGLSEAPDMEQLNDVPKNFWLDEVKEIGQYFDDQLGADTPKVLLEELEALKARVSAL